jgi:hypothetical protein
MKILIILIFLVVGTFSIAFLSYDFPKGLSFGQKIEILRFGHTDFVIGDTPVVDQIRIFATYTDNSDHNFEIKFNFDSKNLRVDNMKEPRHALNNCVVSPELSFRFKKAFARSTLCRQITTYKGPLCEMMPKPEFYIENEKTGFSFGYFRPDCATSGKFLCGDGDLILERLIEELLFEISSSCLRGGQLRLQL